MIKLAMVSGLCSATEEFGEYCLFLQYMPLIVAPSSLEKIQLMLVFVGAINVEHAPHREAEPTCQIRPRVQMTGSTQWACRTSVSLCQIVLWLGVRHCVMTGLILILFQRIPGQL